MFSDLNSEFFSWIRGALLLLFLINFGLYLQNKKKLFLNYSLYLFFVFLFFLKPIVPINWKEFYEMFGYSFFFLSFFFYIEFERILLSSRYTIPFWDGYLVAQKYANLVFSISCPFVYYLFGAEVLLLVICIFSSLISIFIIRNYFVIYKIKGRNVHLFIFGSLSFFFLGNIGSCFIFVNRHDLDTLQFDPMAFIYMGVIVEAIVFTNIIGNVFKQISEKRSNLKVQYALKQKETAELKMTALQSQMNPHFLFNSLNSINNFVLKNEKEEASEYITSFSKLVRLTLKNSENLQITLLEEFDALETYIDLEKTRVSGGFEFIKEIDESLDLHRILVPPLFLQPYIENSIWHGLACKVGPKVIRLSVFVEDENVVIHIEDNGVGIDEEVIERNRRSSKRKFFGSYATEKRIKLMYDSDRVKILTENITTDNSSGTKVSVIFPLKK